MPDLLEPSQKRKAKYNLPIIGGLILFSVVLGTTKLGFIPVPTAAYHATTMHLPTIVASLLEGWPIGMVVGAVFGITSMYTSGSLMIQDPVVALVPRMLVGITPYFTYRLMRDSNEYVRIGCAAVVGTMTNTVMVLGLAVVLEYMPFSKALQVAWIHGLPESIVAVVVVIPALLLLRKLKAILDGV